MSFLKNIKLIVFYLSIFILTACTRIASTPNPGNETNIEGLNTRLILQEEQIEQIGQTLISHQIAIDNYSSLNNELITTIEKINTDSTEQDLLNILNRVQQKIKILEVRTLYTDSLYFAIMNDMVLMENKISSLILSFKEMNALSENKTKAAIPRITDEEYTDKYIESLAYYQNMEWDLSLNGFNYLIKIDNKHDLADNCQYWIGEVYYARADYRRSIIEFEKVSSFLGTNKSDDAQLKLGLCYMNIGKIERAKQEFTILLELYPNSEYHQRANEYLRQL